MATPLTINQGGVVRRRFLKGSDLALLPNSTPPLNPSAGDLWLFPAGSHGEMWTFVYDTSDTSAYKWKYIGGAPLQNGSSASQSSSLTSTFQELDTSLRMTLARAGDYALTGLFVQAKSTAGNALLQLSAWDVTAGSGFSGTGCASNTGAANNFVSVSASSQRLTGWTAGHVLSLAFNTNDATPANTTWFNKAVGVVPIRVA